jgi:hypothetical protein
VIGEPYQELDGLHMRDLCSLQVQRHRTYVALDSAADLVLLLGLREAGDPDFDRPARRRGSPTPWTVCRSVP